MRSDLKMARRKMRKTRDHWCGQVASLSARRSLVSSIEGADGFTEDCGIYTMETAAARNITLLMREPEVVFYVGVNRVP